ncbi:MAG: HipA N-terminal domain-containing protein [Ignavibacteriaceae bacterium]|nr:HipA N-terminal domain-containing protein [Ignavibacteriaceae bacterium]
MSNIYKAEVLVRDIPAGELIKTKEGYIFRYYESYLAGRDLPPVSLSLPRQKEEFASPQLFPFFLGMLPEGENKAILCRTQKIDPEDHLAILLSSAYKESIGAVTVRSIS